MVPIGSLCSQSFPSLVWVSGLLGGKVIGLPPVLNFSSPEIKAKVIQSPNRSLSLTFLGRTGGVRGQEVYLSRNFGGTRRERCARHEDHRCQKRGWQILDYQRREEMDHKRTVRDYS
jgi:hypothetical protein